MSVIRLMLMMVMVMIVMARHLAPVIVHMVTSSTGCMMGLVEQ
jgi:hypothetical protein